MPNVTKQAQQADQHYGQIIEKQMKTPSSNLETAGVQALAQPQA